MSPVQPTAAAAVAEGIESTQQLDAPRALNRNAGQGYRLARPQPARHITD